MDERKSDFYFSKIESDSCFIVTIKDSPKIKDGNCRFMATINSTCFGNHFIPVAGNCFLNFKNDSSSFYLSPGDRLIVQSFPIPIASTLNPGQFDYKYRSSLHRIYQQFNIRKLCTINRSPGFK